MDVFVEFDGKTVIVHAQLPIDDSEDHADIRMEVRKGKKFRTSYLGLSYSAWRALGEGAHTIEEPPGSPVDDVA